MRRLPRSPPVRAPGRSAPRSDERPSSTTAAVLLPGARPSFYSVHPSLSLLALATTEAPLAGCHTPALAVPTTTLAVVPPTSALPPPPAPDSSWHELAECLLPLRSRSGPPVHIHGWFPTSRDVVPPSTPLVAASSCR